MNRTNLIQSPVFITHLNLYGLNSIFIKANDGSSTKESEFFFFFFLANRKWKTKTNNLYARKIPNWRNKEKRKKKIGGSLL